MCRGSAHPDSIVVSWRCLSDLVRQAATNLCSRQRLNNEW